MAWLSVDVITDEVPAFGIWDRNSLDQIADSSRRQSIVAHAKTGRKLTEAECRRIVRLIAKGRSRTDVALDLDVTPATVRKVVQRAQRIP